MTFSCLLFSELFWGFRDPVGFIITGFQVYKRHLEVFEIFGKYSYCQLHPCETSTHHNDYSARLWCSGISCLIHVFLGLATLWIIVACNARFTNIIWARLPADSSLSARTNPWIYSLVISFKQYIHSRTHIFTHFSGGLSTKKVWHPFQLILPLLLIHSQRRKPPITPSSVNICSSGNIQDLKILSETLMAFTNTLQISDVL